MRLLYTKPKLKDLSQGSRIAFARQFRLMSQDEVSDKIGITGECKRRTMTRYEKGDRNPKQDRTEIISKILNVEYNSLKLYTFKEPIDYIYYFMWLEELIPNYRVDLSSLNELDNDYLNIIINGINRWNEKRIQRSKRLISYKEYIEWKLNFKIEENN